MKRAENICTIATKQYDYMTLTLLSLSDSFVRHHKGHIYIESPITRNDFDSIDFGQSAFKVLFEAWIITIYWP